MLHKQQGAAAPAEKLITYREVNDLLGLKCKTSHSVLLFFKRNSLPIIRLNARVIRFRESDVQRLISKGVSQ